MRRRAFLCSAGAGGLVLAGAGPFAREAYAYVLTQARRDKLTPDEVVKLAQEGNLRFKHGHLRTRNLRAEQHATADAQWPAAVVLSCIDSRAPAEAIFDVGIGHIFNARVAGNITNPDILASLEYACAVAGAKLVLVMGHTGCGAIKGAIEGVKIGHLPTLLDKIRPAIAATAYDGERSATNAAFVAAVGRTNVIHSVALIRTDSPVLKDLESKGAIRIIGAMYDVATATVEFIR